MTSDLSFQLTTQYELWVEQLQSAEIPRDLKESELQLRSLSDHISHIQTATFEVAQSGQELLQVRTFSAHTSNQRLPITLDARERTRAKDALSFSLDGRTDGREIN